jgi:hypothetical protein
VEPQIARVEPDSSLSASCGPLPTRALFGEAAKLIAAGPGKKLIFSTREFSKVVPH